MASKFNLPAFPLWASVIFSATLVGLMAPVARNLPLIIGLMFFTTMYHSALLVSSLTNRRPNTSNFYVDPIEGIHIVWTCCFGIFWLTTFSLNINALARGAMEDKDIFIAIFSGIEWLLNAHIILLSIVEWRNPGSSSESEDPESALGDEEDDEHMLKIMYYLAMSRSENVSVPEPPKYAEA